MSGGSIELHLTFIYLNALRRNTLDPRYQCWAFYNAPIPDNILTRHEISVWATLDLWLHFGPRTFRGRTRGQIRLLRRPPRLGYRLLCGHCLCVWVIIKVKARTVNRHFPNGGPLYLLYALFMLPKIRNVCVRPAIRYTEINYSIEFVKLFGAINFKSDFVWSCAIRKTNSHVVEQPHKFRDRLNWTIRPKNINRCSFSNLNLTRERKKKHN